MKKQFKMMNLNAVSKKGVAGSFRVRRMVEEK